MTRPMFDLDRRCTPVDDWPAADRAAWARACLPADPLDPAVGFATRWASATLRVNENGYGRWLGWLERSGRLDPTAAPRMRATRERVTEYLEMLQQTGNAPYTIAGRLQQLGDALRALEPGADWGWILKASSRVRERARPIKDVNERIRSPEEVVQLGLDLMHAADHDRFRTDFDRAVMFRDGLTLALLVYRPLRIKNFASIEVGRHLMRRGEDWWLRFSAEEMKAKRPFEAIWPEELVPALVRYLDVHRKELLVGPKGVRAGADALWIAKGGAPMATNVLAYRITKRTEEEFGTAINPHAFRHMAATTIAVEEPDNITAVPTVLGHSSLKTSEKYYNRAGMLEAGERFHDTLFAQRGRKARTSSSDMAASN